MARLYRALFFWLTLFLFHPGNTWAVQIHPPPEGLYVHMMAHLLFTAALVFLIFFLRRFPLGEGKAWAYFKWSLFFFLLWNLDTMLAHWFSLRLPQEALSQPRDLWSHRLLPPFDFEKVFYFFTRFDHLFCIPAMVFWIMSLKAFSEEHQHEEEEEEI